MERIIHRRFRVSACGFVCVRGSNRLLLTHLSSFEIVEHDRLDNLTSVRKRKGVKKGYPMLESEFC